MDPDFDFSGHNAQFDTFLIGRKTFEAMLRMGSGVQSMPGIQNVVFSRTLRPADYPHVVMSDDAVCFVTELRTAPGKDTALFRVRPRKHRLYEKTGTIVVEYDIVRR